MAKVLLDLSEELHIKLLEIQLDRKKKKMEPTAINKIAVEYLEKALETKKPAN